MELLDETPDGEVLDGPVKPGTICVVLADSEAIYRVGIRRIFTLEDDIRVVAEADSLESRVPRSCVTLPMWSLSEVNF